MRAMSRRATTPIARVCGGVFLGAVLAVGAPGALRAESPEPVRPSEPRRERPILDTLDDYHDYISSRVLGFGAGMDGWLSKRLRDPKERADPPPAPPVYDRNNMDEIEASRLILSPIVTFRDGDGLRVGMQSRGKLHLPQVSERLDLIFDSDDGESRTTPGLADVNDVGFREGPSGSAKLRLRLYDDLKFRSSVEAGLKFKPEPVPRLGVRLRLSAHRDSFTARWTQTFFWETEDGFGQRSVIDLDQGEPGRYLRRLSTSILWSEGSDGVRGGQTLQLYKYLSARRVLGVKFGVDGPLEPSAHVETYSVRALWRQRLHREWLFIEIEPGVEWPRERDYDTTPLVRVKLDIIFGDWDERKGRKK
jgi:hypothetical protein